MFAKSVKIIKKLLNVSKFAKSLQHNKLEDCIQMKGMSDEDKSFLEQVVLTLQNLKQKFKEHPTTLQFSDADDDDNNFPRKFVNLTTCLCSNYEFLLIS